MSTWDSAAATAFQASEVSAVASAGFSYSGVMRGYTPSLPDEGHPGGQGRSLPGRVPLSRGCKFMAPSNAQLHAVDPAQPAKSRGRRVYSEAFKADAVAEARAAQSVAQVSRELGLTRNVWMGDILPLPGHFAFPL
jgi:hypothetical protein